MNKNVFLYTYMHICIHICIQVFDIYVHIYINMYLQYEVERTKTTHVHIYLLKMRLLLVVIGVGHHEAVLLLLLRRSVACSPSDIENMIPLQCEVELINMLYMSINIYEKYIICIFTIVLINYNNNNTCSLS